MTMPRSAWRGEEWVACCGHLVLRSYLDAFDLHQLLSHEVLLSFERTQRFIRTAVQFFFRGKGPGEGFFSHGSGTWRRFAAVRSPPRPFPRCSDPNPVSFSPTQVDPFVGWRVARRVQLFGGSHAVGRVSFALATVVDRFPIPVRNGRLWGPQPSAGKGSTGFDSQPCSWEERGRTFTTLDPGRGRFGSDLDGG